MLFLLGASLGPLGGCGGVQATAVEVPTLAAEPLDLSLLAPAASRLIVRLDPVAIVAQPATRALWELFVTPGQEKRYQARTGIAPSRLYEVVFIEGHQGGQMVLCRGPFDAAQAAQRLGSELATLDVQTDRPLVRREGLAGAGRWAYVALEPDTLLVAHDVSPAVLGGMIARAQTGETELLEPVQTLIADHSAGVDHGSVPVPPLLLLVPEPLAFEGGSGAALLMARQQALGLTLAAQDERLSARFDLRGEFPAGAEENFRNLVKSLASSGLGRALGLAEALPSLRVQSGDSGVKIDLSVRAGSLVRGLKLLFEAELPTLFE